MMKNCASPGSPCGAFCMEVSMSAIGAPNGLAVPFADTVPMPEVKAGSAGTAPLVPRADHQHPRLTSAQTGALDANGQQTIMFTRTFTAEPAVSILAVENDTKSPPDFKVKQFLDDTGAAWATGKPYGGAIVYGSRARTLPTLTAVLTDLLKLSGYNVTEPAAGVKFSIIALQAS